MMKLFDRSDCNCGRQIEPDIAKAICIIGMVLVHCYEILPFNEIGNAGYIYVLVYFLNTIFGAPTFMICMGIGLVYSRKNTPDKIISRGFLLIAVSLIFNAIRFCMPYTITGMFSGDFTVPYLISLIFYVDILSFAGLALVLFGFLKKCKLPDYVIFIIALAMSAVGTFVTVDTGDNWILNMSVGVFLPVTKDPVIEYNAYFPLFNWFIFVAFGYGFGLILKKVKDKKRFYALFSGISAIVMIVYLCICIPNKIGLCQEDITYTMFYKIYDAFIAFLGTVMLFGLYHFASYILPDFIKRFFTFLSKGITKFYIIHWMIYMIIYTLVLMFAENWEIPNAFVGLAISIPVFIVSSLILNRIQKRSELKKQTA